MSFPVDMSFTNDALAAAACAAGFQVLPPPSPDTVFAAALETEALDAAAVPPALPPTTVRPTPAPTFVRPASSGRSVK